MALSSLRAFRVTAILGFLGVALGAFGAHGLKGLFTRTPAAQILWEKAVFYQLVHTVAMLVLVCIRPFRVVPWLFFGGGIVLFCGSLYLLALTDVRWLGIVSPPLGGLCFLAGWLSLAAGPQPASFDP